MAKKTILSIDMRDIGERGARVEPQDVVLKVKKIEVLKGQTSGDNYINMTTTIITPKKIKGTTIIHRCSLKKNALWNLRNTLVAMGMKVPEKIIKLNLKNLLGKTFGATLDDDEWEGTVKSAVIDTFKVGTKSKAKKSAKAEKELEEDEEEEAEDEEEEGDEEEDEDEDEEDEDEEGDEEDEDDEMEELEEL